MSSAMSVCADIALPSPDATAALARQLAGRVAPGDCLLLAGTLGAGKSHFARAMIRALTGNPSEDVPSPTYTLVQTYDAPAGEIWHADLYRLGGPQETDELGLAAAFDSAICLIEWPDRLGPDSPAGAIRLHFTVTGDDSRRLTVDCPVATAVRLGLAGG